MAAGKFVSYLRVSTQRQGRSGLGLQAQHDAVEAYLNGGNWKLIKEFIEVESGKDDKNRPKLQEALQLAKVMHAALIVAKLDRLSRDVEFLARLQKSQVKFVCCDMQDATELTIHIFAAIAQHERKRISERIKVAMAAAKKKGRKFGNPNGARCLQGIGNDAAVEKITANATEHAADILPIIEDIRAKGSTTLREIADELNAREVPTRRSKVPTARRFKWHATTVRNILLRSREAA